MRQRTEIMRRRLAAALTAMVTAVTLLPAHTALAVPSSTPITIEGGGWGHGIGMPQWGAQGMAEHGNQSYQQILSYWYSGTGLKPVSEVSATVPDPLRIGINYVLSGGQLQKRPFRWLDFSAVNGPVQVCKPGQEAGGDCFTANPGESWRYRWYPEDGGFCVVTRNSAVMYSHASSCNIRLFWSDQPNTRVSFASNSDVARTFARGHISFVGPVTESRNEGYLGWTGFHLNVVLSLDDYVKGIAEVPPSWHMEALKSQAVAARTFGAWKATGGVRSDCSCHLVWDTWDQAYRGWHDNSEGHPTYGQRWRDAVDATAGEVVVTTPSASTLAQTYYSSSTGGATENVGDVWNSNQASYPYLASKPDPWSALYAPSTPNSSTTIRWRFDFTAGQIVSLLAPVFPGLTELVSITIEEHNASGSPRRIRVTGIVGGQLTQKDFVSRSPSSGQGTIPQLVSRLGLRSHYIHSISGGGSGSGGSESPTTLATSVGYHDPATGIFSQYVPGGPARTFYFGNPADIPYSGDWSCNGVDTPGLYRVSAGYLFLRKTNTQGIADIQIYYGNPGDVPLGGDWNGNGCDTIGIYRPSNATFYLRNANTAGVADVTISFGNKGDLPLAGDWDGDGRDTVGVYRPSSRMLYLSNSPTGSTVDITYFYSGAQAGDRIIVGDWDGDGVDTVGVYRPSTATFFLRNDYGPGGAEFVFNFGPPNRTPVSGNWG
jgi:SpoIID/LytB domain protein